MPSPAKTIGTCRTVRSLSTQRMLSSLAMKNFLRQAKQLCGSVASESSSEDEQRKDHGDSSDDSGEFASKFFHRAAARSNRERMFDFSTVGSERTWLKDLLLSETESEYEGSDEDEYITAMLKDHLKEKLIRDKYNDSQINSQYGYYAAGLLSDTDLFPDHRRSVTGKRKCKLGNVESKTKGNRKRMKVRKKNFDINSESANASTSAACSSSFGSRMEQKIGLPYRGDRTNDVFMDLSEGYNTSLGIGKRSRKVRNRTPEMMNIRRRRMWQQMAKKELGKVQRAKVNNHRDTLVNCRRVAVLCMRVARQKAMQSQKLMKDTIWRAKRLTREMQLYWKRYDKVERETKRRMEREAEEQRKIDVEMVEAKRQQRKLNFLITQTELYAHFMSRKLGNVSVEEQLKILSQLDEENNPRLSSVDDYDCERMKQLAQKNVSEAFRNERARTNQFDVHSHSHIVSSGPNEKTETDRDNLLPVSVSYQSSLDSTDVQQNSIMELPQPRMFLGRLKGYQLKGMAWLANLYNQGISGILADEMGLGKTVQSIAFLCHIAEHYGVWGPFLVISPASTLHNWQQEMERFVPQFKVVPYWGSPNERKILRRFWDLTHLHTKDASFHVVITSYQLVVSDYKYFNRIKWQYMVLDEAQAIKSSNSMRWKLLLGFNCRNRLLLSGTPIQNSMAELWALLHFIMPTLFDSHEEFNEWFSKDIESHAENKTGIDEKQISRLHMILKPFMLRRIKKDVENELSDKIEIMVYCPLTTRQKLLYVALKKEICVEDLLNLTTLSGSGSGESHSIDRNFTSNLMNLVMQFRKVCNHPELFERRDVRSPFSMSMTFELATRPIFYRDLLLENNVPSKHHWLRNRWYIFKALHVHREAYKGANKAKLVSIFYDDFSTSFSCVRLAGGLSSAEVEQLSRRSNFLFMYATMMEHRHWLEVLHLQSIWSRTNQMERSTRHLLLEPSASRWISPIFTSHTLDPFIFTKADKECCYRSTPIYAHLDHTIHPMVESLDHRIMRSRKHQAIGQPLTLLPEVSSRNSPKHTDFLLSNVPTCMPAFLCETYTKVISIAGHSASLLKGVVRENVRLQQRIRKHLEASYPIHGWSNIIIPDKQTLVSDAGKLAVLDSLLARLKQQGHRVLIYSQMTKMIDLLEEYMWHRKHRYMRLDGSSKISARRDMVADFQNRADIFVFLLSTRAGGLGINLTAADTVIFYDSDWNPTVDQQAMDRAHRLGQTKQVTVYRLICKGTIEERILQRAREKSEIQRMVINGDNFKPDTLKPKEMVSLLLDDEEIEMKYRQKTEERRMMEDSSVKSVKERERKLKQMAVAACGKENSIKSSFDDRSESFVELCPVQSPAQSDKSYFSETTKACDVLDDSNVGLNVRERGIRARSVARGISKRGRPRGSRRGRGASSSVTRIIGRQSVATASTSFDTPVHTTTPLSLLASGTGGIPQPLRRGPGRPRLKTYGPSNQGNRSNTQQTIRIRKPVGAPLAVSLGTGFIAKGMKISSPSSNKLPPATMPLHSTCTASFSQKMTSSNIDYDTCSTSETSLSKSKLTEKEDA
uniref:Chromatin-remodeling ATPase INO80 n=1 Tax=Anopheles albimanus TaxID=7167 RepID=A0A182FL94_ANOAL